ncbi:PREDICTED: uncharacterized protein LOC109192705 [Ipomoea nil]|uniref:uncharacterized protein LOC109192705 n=1 Tax=Ipomoea nil TaxID=35883 RepID=UPI000901D057|nr:PREDICTED: uncharacterized protein LOC109192705 [Ipomoea nil]
MTEILTRAGMYESKPVAIPVPVSRPVSGSNQPFKDPTKYRSIAGALQYLTVTRPDLSYAVNLLCQHMHAPTDAHWAHLKWVLWYVKGTLHYGLVLRKSPNTDIHAYSDSNWASCPTDRKSTAALRFFWVLISFCGFAKRSVQWPDRLMRLSVLSGSAPKLWCDNLGATYMCTNPVFMHETYIEIDYHFVGDKVAAGELQVNFISTKDQLTDIFTKPLAAPRFAFLPGKLQVVALP